MRPALLCLCFFVASKTMGRCTEADYQRHLKALEQDRRYLRETIRENPLSSEEMDGVSIVALGVTYVHPQSQTTRFWVHSFYKGEWRRLLRLQMGTYEVVFTGPVPESCKDLSRGSWILKGDIEGLLHRGVFHPFECKRIEADLPMGVRACI